MKLILDASVAFKVAIDETDSDKARQLLQEFVGGVHEPESRISSPRNWPMLRASSPSQRAATLRNHVIACELRNCVVYFNLALFIVL